MRLGNMGMDRDVDMDVDVDMDTDVHMDMDGCGYGHGCRCGIGICIDKSTWRYCCKFCEACWGLSENCEQPTHTHVACAGWSFQANFVFPCLGQRHCPQC